MTQLQAISQRLDAESYAFGTAERRAHATRTPLAKLLRRRHGHAQGTRIAHNEQVITQLDLEQYVQWLKSAIYFVVV